MSDFKSVIVETSRELSPRERIMMKDTRNAIKLDTASANGEKVLIDVDGYAVLDIHNDAADPQDYKNYVIIDKGGNKYVTGSNSFWRSFTEIYEEMKEADEDFTIEVYQVESKNYKGKSFITCSIV